MNGWFRGFRIRLTVLFGGLSLALGLGLTMYVVRLATARMTEARIEVLQGITRSIAQALGSNLTEREREVLLLSQSPLLTRGRLDAPETRLVLDHRKQAYSNYAWLGVADARGIIQAAADGLLEGQDVSQRPWFANAKRGAYLGDAHEAVLLAKLLKSEDPGQPLRFMDFAAPILDEKGGLRGVLGAHAHWSWVTQTIRATLPGTAGEAGIDVFVVDRNGRFLYPYDRMESLAVPGSVRAAVTRWGDEGDFLTCSVPVESDTATGLGWRILLRQPVAQALAPVAELHRKLLLFSILASLLLMFLAYRFASGISLPVEQLARVSRRIRRGEEETPFPDPSGIREIGELSRSLQDMTQTLIARKRELEGLNATLEEKVEARTRDLIAANQELELVARRDALTGLGNRRAADERLHESFLQMKRRGSAFSVLLMDIDHFKRVNDTFGHEVGDQVLQHLAGVLRGSVRGTDFIARFGGEEFLVILPDVAEGEAVPVAEKIRSAVAQSMVPEVGRITLSIGVAGAGAADAGPDAPVRRADQALYQAKSEGRNRVVGATAS